MKKTTKKDFRLQAKPWITPGIINSIKRRDKLLRLYTKAKDGNSKEELHSQYKFLRNRIVAITRFSKKMYYRVQSEPGKPGKWGFFPKSPGKPGKVGKKKKL